MALYNAAKALGLACVVVPMMRYENDEGELIRLFKGAFHGFHEEGDTDGHVFSIDEEGQETAWGEEVPEGKVSWIGNARNIIDEPQFSYMVVSHPILISTRNTY
jgi:hypothetical protein